MGFLTPDVPDTVIEGPRMDDLRLSDSAFGNDIPSGFGTIKVGGNIIWASEIEEEKITSSTEYGGKGGGGGTQTEVKYNYFCSMAIAFSQRQANNVRKIFANNQLLVDLVDFTTSGSEEGYIYRFYNGSEDQAPDPLIVADKGEATPAYRGLCYLVCERWPLEAFNNRIPSVTAEINFEGAPDDYTEDLDHTIGVTVLSNYSLTDWGRGIIYLYEGSSALRAHNAADMSLIKTVTTGYIYHAVDQATGHIAVAGGGGDLQNVVRVIDPIADILLSRTQFTSIGAFIALPRPFIFTLLEYSPFTIVGLVHHNLSKYAFEIRSPLQPASAIYYEEASRSDARAYDHATMYNGSGLAAFGHVNFTTNQINIRIAQVTKYLEGNYYYPWAQVTELTITPTDIDPLATGFNLPAVDGSMFMTFDQETADLYLWAPADTGDYMIRYDPLSGSVLWATKINSTPDRRLVHDYTYISGNIVGFQSDAGDTPEFTKIDASSGDILIEYSDVYGDPISYNDKVDTIIGEVSSVVKLTKSAAQSPIAVDDIIDYITEQVGLNKIGDSDTSSITDSIGGYVSNKIIAGNKIPDQLGGLFNFDIVERDGYLKYVYRGGSSVATIPEGDFVWRGRGKTNHYIEKRTQEAELPYEFSIKFKDKDDGLREQVVTVSRVINPNRTVLSRNKKTLSLPISHTVNEMKQQAEKLLYQEWVSRINLDFQLAQKYLYLDPTDVVTITLDNGLALDCSLHSGDVGADFSTRVNAKQQSAGQYISTVTADGGTYTNQTLAALSYTQYFVIDSPYLRDFDNTNGAYHIAYHAANKYAGGTAWTGSVLQQSRDANNYFEVDRVNTGTPWGICSSVLGNTDSHWRTDHENTVDVNMVAGGSELVSVTHAQMVNGANAAFIIKADGEVSIIQYQTVTDLGDNVYRLSVLLRGRRGTNTMDKDYLGSEYFVVINSSYLSKFNLSLDDRSSELGYRSFTVGRLPELGTLKTLTHEGRDLKPYSPVHLTATLDVSNNIDFAWQRRTRLGGEVDLLDGGDGTVDLVEDDERYELDIYFGGSIIRTITDITTAAYEYIAADQTTDGFTPGSVSTIQVDVYQISGIVGRGFAGQFNVEVQ